MLNQKVTGCRLCPRLVEFREGVPKRAQFKEQNYWRKPVPGYGDPNAWLLILGLAPSAHGGNRTGRIFTGDPSAVFLMRALYQAGLANQPTSETLDDGLILKGCWMTAAVKCVPPQNRPTRKEEVICSQYLTGELQLLSELRAVLALGGLAFRAYLDYVKGKAPFSHGKKVVFEGFPTLYGSYHPSPQNTYTGKLTEEMLVKLLQTIYKENI